MSVAIFAATAVDWLFQFDNGNNNIDTLLVIHHEPLLGYLLRSKNSNVSKQLQFKLLFN